MQRKFQVSDTVVVRNVRDPFNRAVATVVHIYADGGLLLRFHRDVSTHLWPYSPRDVRKLVEV